MRVTAIFPERLKYPGSPKFGVIAPITFNLLDINEAGNEYVNLEMPSRYSVACPEILDNTMCFHAFKVNEVPDPGPESHVELLLECNTPKLP